jgi:hypothetical protein
MAGVSSLRSHRSWLHAMKNIGWLDQRFKNACSYRLSGDLVKKTIIAEDRFPDTRTAVLQIRSKYLNFII